MLSEIEFDAAPQVEVSSSVDPQFEPTVLQEHIEVAPATDAGLMTDAQEISEAFPTHFGVALAIRKMFRRKRAAIPEIGGAGRGGRRCRQAPPPATFLQCSKLWLRPSLCRSLRFGGRAGN